MVKVNGCPKEDPIKNDEIAIDIIQRLKIPYNVVVGKGTIKALNEILKPALKKNLISKQEDSAIRNFRRRVQNRQHSQTKQKKTNSDIDNAEEQVEKAKSSISAKSILLSKDAIEARNLADEIKKMEKMRDEWSNTESDFSNIDDDSLDELERYSEMRQKRARDILDGKYPNEEISRRKSKKNEEQI